MSVWPLLLTSWLFFQFFHLLRDSCTFYRAAEKGENLIKLYVLKTTKLPLLFPTWGMHKLVAKKIFLFFFVLMDRMARLCMGLWTPSSRRVLQREPQIPLDNSDNPQRFFAHGLYAPLACKVGVSCTSARSQTVMDTLGIVADPRQTAACVFQGKPEECWAADERGVEI